MNRLFACVFSAVIAVSLTCAPVAFADAGAGKKVFNAKKRCSKCHKATGEQTKFKPVGPGLKGVGAFLGKDFLLKWLSPDNKALFEANGPGIQKIKENYKASKKKDLVLKKSQMVKMLGIKSGKKKAKIPLTDQQRADLVDYLMTL